MPFNLDCNKMTQGNIGQYEGYQIQQENHGEIYLVLDGKLHWIPNIQTFNNFWDTLNGVHKVLTLQNIPMGPAFSNGACLGKSDVDKHVYLITNDRKRWIISEDVMAKYAFNDSFVQTMTQAVIDSIATGPNIS